MKTHSRVESHDSRVWIETLDFDQVPVPYTSVIVVGLPAGVRGGGAIAGQSPTLFRADAGTPSIDRHSGQWRTQNVTKQPGEGATGGARPGKRNGRSAHVGRRWTIAISRTRGQMGAQNGGHWPGLRHRGACVRTGWEHNRGT